MNIKLLAQAIADGINSLGWSPDVPNENDELIFSPESHEIQTIVDKVIEAESDELLGFDPQFIPLLSRGRGSKIKLADYVIRHKKFEYVFMQIIYSTSLKDPQYISFTVNGLERTHKILAMQGPGVYQTSWALKLFEGWPVQLGDKIEVFAEGPSQLGYDVAKVVFTEIAPELPKPDPIYELHGNGD